MQIRNFIITSFTLFFILLISRDLVVEANTLESVNGTRVPYIEKDANLCHVKNMTSEIISSVIENHLNEINKLDEVQKMDTNYNHRIAQEILAVSRCFQLDPLVFTSLIGHESHFYNLSVSNTGAQGLGQLTGIGLQEIAQQLQADYVPLKERGTDSSRKYFEEAITCVEISINGRVPLNHWWNYSNKSDWRSELKENTILNLTYSAIIYKISFSKMMGRLVKNSKGIEKNLDYALRKILNFYNGASQSEQITHYEGTRKTMNQFLTLLNDESNKCFWESQSK